MKKIVTKRSVPSEVVHILLSSAAHWTFLHHILVTCARWSEYIPVKQSQFSITSNFIKSELHYYNYWIQLQLLHY